MNIQKFDIKDPRSRQIFINLRLAGFKFTEISAALGVSYSTTIRIYDELKPEINAQIAKKKCFDNSSLTDRIDKFLSSLEKHFYIIEEGMIDTEVRMGYEEYVVAMQKFANAYEKLVKLRILLQSSQSLNDVSQSDNTENVPESSLIDDNTENVPESSLIEDNTEYFPQSSLIADNNGNVPQSSLIADNNENVPQSSLIADNENTDSTILNEQSDKEIYSNENNIPQSNPIADNNENVSHSSLIAENNSNINKENISYFKYRKQKLSKNEITT